MLLMKIEEEIKQKKFSNEFEKLVVNILFTSSWLSSKQNELMKPYGISIQQFNILRILKGQYPNSASVNLLIERMLDKNSNASRLVDKLKTKKLVQRSECSVDRRKVDVIISEKGIELIDEVSDKMNIMTKTILSIDESNAKKLNEQLDRIRNS
jgi:DNA-binding MarR family transcriptional regulator